MTIKAIETTYRGVKFRSRTEARWAVFFTQLKFQWQYEEEGYQLSSGERYLPDFKIRTPDQKIYYVEIKYDEFDDMGADEISIIRKAASELRTPFLILNGTPEYRLYNLIDPEFPPNSFCAVFFKDYSPFIDIADEYWINLTEFDSNNGRMSFPFSSDRAGKAFGKSYVMAIDAARSARFEHGETPR